MLQRGWKVLKQEETIEGGWMAICDAFGGLSQPDTAVEGIERFLAEKVGKMAVEE